MNQYSILDAEDHRRKKINFWFAWTVGNALGAAMGWVLGEIIGRAAFEALGIRIALLVATLIFEIFVWIPRIIISRYFRELNLVGYFEIMIWMIVEATMIIVIGFIAPSGSNQFTLDAPLANVLGAAMSMLFVVIGLSDVHLIKNPAKYMTKSIWWVMITALKGLLGLTVITILFLFILTTSTKISSNAEFPPIIDWMLSGLFLGVCIGAITGLGYVRSVSRRDSLLA
jgi:hypothetical protein